ncbi:MAG TPA: rhodanese-like domain-containing protein [Hyphomicrobiaceae bacterium]|nr:rhodanese-like domain-containing protein [Hyphomicrobiaceae bacterium]
MTTPVTQTPPAPPSEAASHFSRKLVFETDCADVYAALRTGAQDFVLLDVREAAAYARGHVPGALTLPHDDMTAERMMAWPHDMLFVVYCAGPHCNGADKAARKLALLGRPVKVMIGGIVGWADQGFPFEVASSSEA